MKKEFVNNKFTDTLGYAFANTQVPEMRVGVDSKKEYATEGLQQM